MLGFTGSQKRLAQARRPLPLSSSRRKSGNVKVTILTHDVILQVANGDRELCLDSACKPEDMHKPVGLWPCHGQGGNQVTPPPIRQRFWGYLQEFSFLIIIGLKRYYFFKLIFWLLKFPSYYNNNFL